MVVFFAMVASIISRLTVRNRGRVWLTVCGVLYSVFSGQYHPE